MNQEKNTRVLTHDDFKQAVDRAGGPKAIRAGLKSLRLAQAHLEKEQSRILEQYSRHWIAVGPEGLVANVPLPENPSEEDQEKAINRLFEMIDESGSDRAGCLIQYIDSGEEVLIL
ncbi:MAG: hypothetical protein OXI91_12790 [Chloroflexota bacterium]|nr:hypothetical protein [Chloroflexota bacterium]